VNKERGEEIMSGKAIELMIKRNKALAKLMCSEH
jgi:hypothetical protein